MKNNFNAAHGFTPFAFNENLVRVLTDEAGELLFIAKDVALALGYQWNGLSRISHVPEEWRGVTTVSTLYTRRKNSRICYCDVAFV